MNDPQKRNTVKRPPGIRRILLVFFGVRVLIPAAIFTALGFMLEYEIIDVKSSRTWSGIAGPLMIVLGALTVLNFIVFLYELIVWFFREPRQ